MGLTDNILWRLAVLGGSQGGSPAPGPDPVPPLVVDGKTRFYWDFGNRYVLTVNMQCTITPGAIVAIDWGDGTAETYDNAPAVISHTFRGVGEYVTVMTVSGGTVTLGGGAKSYNFLHGNPEFEGGYHGLAVSMALRRVVIGENVIAGMYCFCQCTALTEADLSLAVSADAYVFQNCSSLARAVWPANQAAVSDNAFDSCRGLVYFPVLSPVTVDIGQRAFIRCDNLRDTAFPATAATIGYGAFDNCFSLENITLPETLRIINAYTFNHCINIQTVRCLREKPPSMYGIGFHNLTDEVRPLFKIVVPKGSLAAYQAATNWALYAEAMVEAEE